MNIILIGVSAIVGLGLLVGIATIFARRSSDEPDVIHQVSGDCNTCTGLDESCEQTCMMEAATKEIEYFDDEELDRFNGRDSSDYSNEEADEFREILYTMHPEEAKSWNRSLILRGINIPNQVKDELITLIEG
ncbi:hypothetical protein [Prevotella corporis]|uniref:hypothetical protein n=1 Tax=Prevotella corporis TaxID=28128 RepID=UPI0023666380|nr:hypothetical protein [Prevotella corporis]